nr:hypothetical protein [Mucilaginibacter gracilis]
MDGIVYAGYTFTIVFTNTGITGLELICLAVEQHEQVQKGGQVSWLPCLLQDLLF